MRSRVTRSRLVLRAGLLLAGPLFVAAPCEAARQARGDATIEVVDAARAPIRVIAPADGTALIAGTQARIAWIPAVGSRAVDFEEWEAFLSVDGGATYPLRLTPHLDRDLAEYGFDVPDVVSADARILLRWGDERHESALALPVQLQIVRGASVLPITATPLSASRRGETALPGDAGVYAWAEGTRRGGARRLLVADRSGGAWSEVPALIVGERGSPFVAPVDPQPHVRPAGADGAPHGGPSRRDHARAPAPHRLSRTILALHQRLNT